MEGLRPQGIPLSFSRAWAFKPLGHLSQGVQDAVILAALLLGLGPDILKRGTDARISRQDRIGASRTPLDCARPPARPLWTHGDPVQPPRFLAPIVPREEHLPLESGSLRKRNNIRTIRSEGLDLRTAGPGHASCRIINLKVFPLYTFRRKIKTRFFIWTVRGHPPARHLIYA